MKPVDQQLFKAIKQQHPVAVQTAIDNGANPNAVSPREKMSALEFACSQDVSEVVRVLLHAGAEVPAHVPGWVAQHGWEQSLHCLTDGFVDANAVDAEGKTILHHAVAGKKLGAIRLLVKRGANPKMESPSGETPFAMAETMKRHDMMSAMIV